jgi:hypothetical protein
MKGIFTVILLVGLALLGYLIYNFTRARQRQADLVVFEVSTDSIKAYEQRIEELELRIQGIRSRITLAPLTEQLIQERQLSVLERQLRDLKVAVEQWRQARTQKTAADIYRQCILLYGKAAGVCELLLTDTLPAPQSKE